MMLTFLFDCIRYLLYADDTIVLAESVNELQMVLNAVKEYCNKWSLTVNTSDKNCYILTWLRKKFTKLVLWK